MRIILKIFALILLFFNIVSLTSIGSGAFPLMILVNLILIYFGWVYKYKK